MTDNLSKAIERAQKRANATGRTHYVGMTYTNRYYATAKRPRNESVWTRAIVEPECGHPNPQERPLGYTFCTVCGRLWK